MRRTTPFPPQMFLIILAVVTVIGLILLFLPSEANQAKKTVQQFYKHEQNWDFISAWELFHPDMQAKFTKPSYLQNRSHIFMDHFGVDSFSFTLEKPKKRTNWRMNEDQEPFDTAYEITVTKEYNGTYGRFKLVQDVFVVRDEKAWKILWDYN
ncbi:hypothetical protein [Alkalihalobacterium bogoriense]|uniref:hypothetical protein n=1 Tax=Alkalihalobacterium bogoriense TaxID=246272 RepID=UPI0006841380|nr:hypothetical protein [Alkalihalobacterium bogoriense]